MNTLNQIQQQQGATLATDHIPLHFGDMKAEYTNALSNTAIFDRSHEGRLQIHGKDRIEILNRISTNDLVNMQVGEGRPTIFTNANGRIIDRVTVYNRADSLLIITEPGRGDAIQQFLTRQIFFNDDAQVTNITAQSHMFALHGPQTPNIIQAAGIDAPYYDDNLQSVPIFAAPQKAIVESSWIVIVLDAPNAHHIWQQFTQNGAKPTGSIVYNMLRIRAGKPAFGRELTTDFIPLEIGLWDEVSFSKGCYTGQEIIARMESRRRLAKVMVRVTMSNDLSAPQPIQNNDGKTIGTLTSAVTTANDEKFGIAVIKTDFAQANQQLYSTNNTLITVMDIAGAPPPEDMLKKD